MQLTTQTISPENPIRSLPHRPLVIVIGGLDPSGAGLQADIETCAALGVHALPITTAVTIQNTARVVRIIPLAAKDVFEQLTHLTHDIATPAACKIGMLPNPTVIEAVGAALRALPPTVPIFLDPVMRASSGAAFTDEETLAALRRLLPQIMLVKPNSAEAQRLAQLASLAAAAQFLAQSGCRYALLSGTDDARDERARHVLYRDGIEYAAYAWPLLDGLYHGTGCTLTTAIAAFVALGCTMEAAVAAAQNYTWQTLVNAYSIGARQAIPARMFGARANPVALDADEPA